VKKLPLLFEEIYSNIFMIRLPFYENPGPINVFLFIGQKTTLVDTGIKATSKILKTALEQKGLFFSDIAQIVLTHGHPDHYGAAQIIRNSSNAVTMAHEDDKRYIEKGRDISPKQSRQMLSILGIPKLYQFSMPIMDMMYKRWADNFLVDKVIHDSDSLVLGDYQATVISTPGHSKGSVCLFLEKEGILFSGDHIMNHMQPNPFVMLEEGHLLPRRMSQIEYYASIEKIERLKPQIIYPGHGEAVRDISPIINTYQARFKKRQHGILNTVKSAGLTPYEIALHLFPRLKGRRFFFNIVFAVSEVFTHLQVLEHEKKVVSYLDNGKLLFEASGN